MESQKSDQERFDEAVNRKGKVALQALAGVGILAAVLMSMVALVQSGEKHEASVSASAKPAAATTAVGPAQPVAQSAPAAAAKPVSLKIIGSYKKGPDGKMHDALTQTEFAVKVGQPVTLKIDNTDNAPHSITSTVAGVNIIAQPGVHTYTLVVSKAGKFEWYCMLPCDSDANGWAMQNPGYMSGYITAT
jgi:plastocyanin